MKLPIKKLHQNAKLPVYATTHAAGMDLHACIEETVVLQHLESALVPTGLAIELPDNMEAQIRGRSGLAAKNAVWAFPGTIDADYRGEIKVVITNFGRFPFKIEPDMRIAQMVVNAAVVKCRPEFVDEISESARGEGGFGSTGEFSIDNPMLDVSIVGNTINDLINPGERYNWFEDADFEVKNWAGAVKGQGTVFDSHENVTSLSNPSFQEVKLPDQVKYVEVMGKDSPTVADTMGELLKVSKGEK